MSRARGAPARPRTNSTAALKLGGVTVSSTASVQTYTSNGSQVAFPVPFYFLDDSNLVVQKYNGDGSSADATVVTLGLNIDYTVSGRGSQAGGTVLLGAAVTSGWTVRIRRVLPLTQSTSFRTQGAFSPSSHEAALDRLTMAAQQLNDGVVVADALVNYGVSASSGVVTATGGTSARSLANRFADVRDARDWGAVADGTTDDRAAVQAAIDAAFSAGGGVVRLPVGTLKLQSQLQLKNGVMLQGQGHGSTTLDFSGGTFGDNIAIKSEGTLTALPALASNIAKDGSTAVFATAPSVSAGDILRTYNTTDSTFSAARTYYRAGEFSRVQSLSSATVTTDSPFWAAYTSGGTTAVHKVNVVRVGVQGLRIKLKSGLTGVQITYGHQVLLSDLRLTGTDVSHITVSQCFEGILSRIYIDDQLATAAASYGITIENSQRIHVQGCILTTARHGLTVGGTVGPVNRELLVEGNTFGSYSANYSADCHGNTEHSTFRNNRCLNGLSVAGDFITVQHNDIRAQVSNGIGVLVYEAIGASFVIQGNRIRAAADYSAATTTGLINAGGNNTSFQYATRGGTLRVIENTLDFPGTYGGYAAYIGNIHATIDFNVEFERNSITGESAPTATTRYALRLLGDGVAGHGFRRISICDNRCYRADFRTDKTAASFFIFERNQIFDCPREGLNMVRDTSYSATQAEQRLIVRNNVIMRPGKTGAIVRGDGDGSKTSVFIQNNVVLNAAYSGTTGSSSTDSAFYVDTVLRVVLEHNVWGKDDAVSAQQRTFYINVATELFERDNYGIGGLIDANASVTTRLANMLTGSIVWDPGSLADGAGETSAGITVTGAALGDFVQFSAPYDLQGITATGYVSGTNGVKIRLQNETGGTIDLASGTWKVRVFKATA